MVTTNTFFTWAVGPRTNLQCRRQGVYGEFTPRAVGGGITGGGVPRAKDNTETYIQNSHYKTAAHLQKPIQYLDPKHAPQIHNARPPHS